MYKVAIVLFNLMLITLIAACAKENHQNSAGTPPATALQTTNDQLHCHYSYLHETDPAKSLVHPDKITPLSYKPGENKGTIQIEDDLVALRVSYEAKFMPDGLKDPSLNIVKTVRLEIGFRNKASNSQTEDAVMLATVAMGWNLWNLPVGLQIQGEKYNQLSINCGFFNN